MGEALQNSGAEVFRVEDTLNRIAVAYGAEDVNVFVITSSIVVTLTMPSLPPQTETRRLRHAASNDLLTLEKLNALSRRICTAPPSIEEFQRQLNAILAQHPDPRLHLAGSVLAASSFAIFFGGNLWDGLLAGGIADAYNFLVNTVPALAAILVGGIWQVFVIFGVHWGVTPMCLANFANYGCDSFQAFQTCAVIAQAAACFGVFLKTKKADIKNVSLSAGLTGIFGITEPAIYGVTLRLKKPFVCGCVGGAIGALIISFFNTKYYVYAGLPGLLTTVNAMSDANPSSFTGMMIGVLATIIVTILLVQVVGCDEKESAKK